MLENFFEPQLRAKGFKGTSQDMWSKYLSEKGFKGPIPDSEMHWLASLGFHGTLEDRYDQLFKKLGLHGTIDDMASSWDTGDEDSPPIPPDPEPQPTLGPSDIVIEDSKQGSIGGIFPLGSHSMTLGVVCYVDGNLEPGELQATHGGEPLTLVRADGLTGGVVSAIFYGNDLTVEEAELRVFTTSGREVLGPALMRMRDDFGYSNGIDTSWNDGRVTYAVSAPRITTKATADGTILIAQGVLSYREGGLIQGIGDHPPIVTGLRGRVLAGDYEEVDHTSFTSDYWVESEDGEYILDTDNTVRPMSLTVDIPPNTPSGLRLDYSTPEGQGLSVFYERPNGSYVNMLAGAGTNRRWYLPIPPSPTGYTHLRIQCSGKSTISNIQLIRNPFGVFGNMASVHGPHLNSGWETTGYVIGGVRSTLSAFAINNKQN